MTRISEVDVRTPCPSMDAIRNHLAHSEGCTICGVEGQPAPAAQVVDPLVAAIRTQQRADQ